MILSRVIKYANANAIEATWVDGSGTPLKCRVYAGKQMAELRADLGSDASTYEALIAGVGAAVVPYIPTPEEIAKIAQAVADAAARGAARADATIIYLVNHTPAECYAKVQADVTDLASARIMLGRLAMAISVLARRELR